MYLIKNDRFIKYLKTASLGFICLFIYFFLPNLEIGFLKLYGIDYDILSTSVKAIYVSIWDIITICLIMMILYGKIDRDLKNMKKNHKAYFKKYFKFYLIALGVMILSNLMINLFVTNGIATNEEYLRDTFVVAPIYVYFASVVFAPLIEELVFRQGIRNIISNKIIFILVSGLVFGGLHVLTGFDDVTDLLYIIPYSAPGIAFAYMLADSDNIFISIAIHCMHNGILMALQFLILFS